MCMVRFKNLPDGYDGIEDVTMSEDFECPMCNDHYDDKDEEVFMWESPAACLTCDFCGYMTGHTIKTDI